MLLSQRHYGIANALAFQIAWPVCVLGGDLVAICTTVALLLSHLFVIRLWQTELLFVCSAGVLGFLFDLALLKLGLLQGASAVQPLWMWCLWFMFAATIGYSMQWFRNHLLIGALFAGFFAPLSYSIGARLSEIDLMAPQWLTLLLIGLGWAVVFPALLLLREAIEKHLDMENPLH
ncbi:MAG: DUF2878 domain-containing protein [Pseudomonadota bacterium]